ncbi:flagellar basal-body rod modification protein FlgD [Balnearium lithotrophicum]|uniref:Basal-body rod modification protein FlgD n=1 Tax=Balnearium lithotrophicum TaxID=223788 RepID=A0A521CA91_9BACT|nr:flagellar hook capping FlgD N-terminal domain-containing protein [Balnearium lithotrophicum]SMO56397.1 flagellar basal-body rod modification protein FlgD [Balnearium lithotrophicum]
MDVGSLYFNKSKPKIVDAGYDNSKMSRTDFMKVLLTQLQWQDPLEAENIDDMINNSVKLREMEVLDTFENNIDKMIESIKTVSLFYASNFIGKKVIYEGSKIVVKNGKGQFSFNLNSPASKVDILVTDNVGNVVDRKEFFNLTAGTYPVEVTLNDGYYNVIVESENSDGSKEELKIESEVNVSAVRKENDKVVLDTEIGEIPIENIIGLGG